MRGNSPFVAVAKWKEKECGKGDDEGPAGGPWAEIEVRDVGVLEVATGAAEAMPSATAATK